MTGRPDPVSARALGARLEALGDALASAEDEVLATLVVSGRPAPQRAVDDWLDQVADTLRSLGEAAAELRAAVATRLAGASPPGAPVAVSRDPAGPRRAAGTPTEVGR